MKGTESIKIQEYMAKVVAGEFTNDELWLCGENGLFIISNHREKPTEESQPTNYLLGGRVELYS